MKKSQEFIVKECETFQIVHYNYYFKDKKEYANYKLQDNETMLSVSWVQDSTDYTIMMNVEAIRQIQSKHIYDEDEYKVFIKNLQKTQYNFCHNDKWYNKWIDYISKKLYGEVKELVELLNEFYITGKESAW